MARHRPSGMSRRRFLGSSATAAAATALFGCASDPDDTATTRPPASASTDPTEATTADAPMTSASTSEPDRRQDDSTMHDVVVIGAGGAIDALLGDAGVRVHVTGLRGTVADVLRPFGPVEADGEGGWWIRPIDPERIPDVVAALVAARSGHAASAASAASAAQARPSAGPGAPSAGVDFVGVVDVMSEPSLLEWRWCGHVRLSAAAGLRSAP